LDSSDFLAIAFCLIVCRHCIADYAPNLRLHPTDVTAT